MDFADQLAANTTIASQEKELITSLLPNRNRRPQVSISDKNLPAETPKQINRSRAHPEIPQTEPSNAESRDDSRVVDPAPNAWNNDDYEDILKGYYAMVNPYPLYAIAYSLDIGLSEPRPANISARP